MSELQNTIDRYNLYVRNQNANFNLKNKDANKKTAATIGKETAAEIVAEETKEKNAKQVFDDVQRKRVAFNKPPKYFKPAFLLETLTPRVHARLLFTNKDQFSDRMKITKYDLFNNTTVPTVGNASPMPTHNYIKSFTYNVAGGQEEGMKGTMEIIDVDNSLAEAFMLRYMQLCKSVNSDATITDGTVLCEVEYGWYVPETLEAKYNRSFGNAAKVKFTDNLIFIVQKPEMKYNSDGTISLNLDMRADPNQIPPLLWWKPFESLGRYPAQTLAMVYFVYTMMQIRVSAEKHKNFEDRDFLINLGRWMYIEYMAGTGNRDDLIKVLKVIRDAFCTTNDESFSNNTYLSSTALKELAKAVQGDPISEKNKKVRETEDKITTPKKSNEYTAIVNEGITPIEILGYALGPDSEYAKKAAKVKRKQNTVNTKRSSLLDGIFNCLNYSTGSFDKAFRDWIRDLQKNDKTNYEKISKFLNNIGPFLSNWEIHPYIMEKYIISKFEEEKKNQSGEIDGLSNVEIVFIDMVNMNMIMPTGISNIITSTHAPFIMDRTQREQWCRKVSEYDVGANTPWLDYIASIVEKQKIVFETNDTDSAKILGKEIKKGDKTTKIPVDIQCVFFVTNSKGAVENIETMIKLVGLSIKNFKDLKNESIVEVLKERENVLKQHLKVAKNTLNQSNKVWAFIIKDLLPGNTIFNADVAESSILQAYSYRAAIEGYDGQWNPGYPSMWDINFHDVMSYETELDFYSAMVSVTAGAKPFRAIEGDIDVMDDFVKKVQDKTATGNKLIDEIENGKNQKGEKIQTEERQRKVGELEAIAQELTALQQEAKQKQRMATYPITWNMDFNFKTTNNGSVPEVLAAKRGIQSLRNRLMMESLNYKVKMSVLGDPSYKCSDIGKYIFTKVINWDGSLGPTTGLLTLSNVSHKISGGSFVTEIEANVTNTSDPLIAKSMYEGIYHNDNMVIGKK